MPDARPLLVIDGDNLAHRAFHALPSSIRDAHGKPINAIVGWTNLLVGLWESVQPRAVFVAWDTLDTPTFRHQLWPEYQGGRDFDPNLVAQLARLPELSRVLGCGVGQQAGYEADDLMATVATAEADAGGRVLLVTTDKDAYQLVSDRISILVPRRGGAPPRQVGPADVEALLNVSAYQVADYKALAGDSSDRIPGIRGIGPKAAAALLKEFGNLETVLASRPDRFQPEDAERARMFRKVVGLQFDADAPLPESRPLDWAMAAALLRTWGAARLAERLDLRLQQALSGQASGPGAMSE